jgi:ABC-type Fe3+ transport system substrate-binding protein
LAVSRSLQRSAPASVDRGEGAPAMRMIPSIPLAGGSTTVLKPDGYHAMLLENAREPAAAKALLDFFTSPRAISILKSKGLTPG